MSDQRISCAHTVVYWRPGPPEYWECQIACCGRRFVPVNETTVNNERSQPAQLPSKNCSECSALRDALEFLYAKWENGDPCTDGGEPDGASMGNAFRLNEREEKWILSLIPKFPTNPQPPAPETRAVVPETLVVWVAADYWRCDCKSPGDINHGNSWQCRDCGTIRPEKVPAQKAKVVLTDLPEAHELGPNDPPTRY